MTLWSDNRANGGGRRQRTRRYVGALWSAGRPCGRWRSDLVAPTSLSAIVRLGSGRYGCSGWTRQSGRRWDRPRYRAGIAAERFYRAAVCATAATSAGPLPGGTVRAAGARSGKPCGVPGVLWTGSGQTGRAGRNRLAGRTRVTPRHERLPSHTPYPPLSVRRPQSGAEAV